MKTKLLWFGVVLATVWALKRYYSGAGADDLRWVLAPNDHLAGAISGVSFTEEAGAGFISRERLFLIEKACAGLNFMIAAFAMVAFAMRRHAKSLITLTAVWAGSIAVAYAAAVIVNASRIVIALWLMGHPSTFAGLSAGQVHRLEGILVYFGALVLLWELMQRLSASGAVSARSRV